MSAVLTFYNDGAKSMLEAIDESEHAGIAETMQEYVEVIQETLQRLGREYGSSRLETKESQSAASDASSFSLALELPSGLRSIFDMQNLLTAKGTLDASLASKVLVDEEGILQVEDEALGQSVELLLESVNPTDLLQAALSEEQEQVLVDALSSLAPEMDVDDEEEVVLEPVHPGDLLTLILAFVADAVGSPSSASASRPEAKAAKAAEATDGDVEEEEEEEGESSSEAKSKKGGGLGAVLGVLGKAKGLVFGALGSIKRKIKTTQRSIWRIEEIGAKTVAFALKVAKKSARPILVFLVVNRALQTIEASRTTAACISRLPPNQRAEAYYSALMGPDWKEQFEKDWIDAAKEVEEGLITDDYVEEKRRLSAAMLRRLEVDEWDKERMRHFYYGSYGMGPWYLDMEERLHNPFFTTARAWNGPIEGWVGKNRVYRDSVDPAKVDFDTSALELIESKKGVKLSSEQRRRVMLKQMPDIGDALVEPDNLFAQLAGGREKAIEALRN